MTQRLAVLILLTIKAVVFSVEGQSDQLLAGVEAHAATNQIVKLKGMMSDTLVLSPDQSTIEKIKVARSKMKAARSFQTKNGGPQTLEEAAAYLWKSVAMACPPGACVEYDGVFYFSGGTSTKIDTNFVSGYAIRKGGMVIDSWQK